MPPFRVQATKPVKSSVEGVITGYIALWGTPDLRDAYGTWFDHEKPPEMNLDLLPVAMFYEHTMDQFVGKRRIGVMTRVFVDDEGIGFEGQLDREHKFFSRFVREIRAGEHGISSGTADHLAHFDDDGRFVHWPLADVSITKIPAEQRMAFHPVTLLRSSMAQGEDGRDARAIQQSSDAVENDEDFSTTRLETVMNIKELLQQMVAEGATAEQIIAALVEVGISPDEMMAVFDGLAGERGPVDEAQAIAPDNVSVPAAVTQQAEQPTNPTDQPAPTGGLEGFGIALQDFLGNKEQQALVGNYISREHTYLSGVTIP